MYILCSSISHADILIAKYLLIENRLPSNELLDNIIDDLFKATPKELPYLFPALGLLLEQQDVRSLFVVHSLLHVYCEFF
jgi:hypothetical protein